MAFELRDLWWPLTSSETKLGRAVRAFDVGCTGYLCASLLPMDYGLLASRGFVKTHKILCVCGWGFAIIHWALLARDTTRWAARKWRRLKDAKEVKYEDIDERWRV